MDVKTATNELVLPALPKGYFYRISRGPFHIDQIEIRKKVLFFSKQIDSTVLFFYAIEDGERVGILNPYDNINNAARALFYSFKTQLPKHRAPARKVRVEPIRRGKKLEEIEKKYDTIYNTLFKDYHFTMGGEG